MKDSELINNLKLKTNATKHGIALEFLNEHINDKSIIEEAASSLTEVREQPISKPLYQYGKSNPENYNKQFNTILADLTLLFSYASSLSESISNHDNLDKHVLYTLRLGLSKIKEKIDAYKFIVNNSEGFTEVKYENFNNKKSFENFSEENMVIFSNPKANTFFTKELLCTLNKNSEALTLPELGSIKPTAPIPEIVEQTGKYLKAKINNYPLINMVESETPNNVWSETILTDKPFQVPMEGEEFGAICKFRIILEKTMPINNLSINPFVKHPIKFIKITSYQSVEDYHKGKEYGEDILSDDYETYFDPFYLEEATTLEFPTKQCQVLEFLINQEHYELEQYTIKEKDKNEIDLTQKVYYDKKTNISIPENSNIGSVLELDYANSNVIWSYFQKLINNFFSKLDVNNKENVIRSILNSVQYIIPELNSESFNGIISNRNEDEKERLVNINKYEYQYGFENISPSYKEFADKGMYVSRPLYFKDNIKEISLVVDDYNPTYYHEDSELLATSIEYYVTNLKNPSSANTEWIPILPENHPYHDDKGRKVIKSERLIPFRGTKYLIGRLRFPAIEDSIEVYKNGEIIENISYHQNGYTYEDGTQEEEYFDGYIINAKGETSNLLNNIYTVNYVVDETDFDPSIIDLEKTTKPIDFIDDDGTLGEKFKLGTNKKNSIRLTYYPYIDRNELNDSSNKINTEIADNPLEGHYSPNWKNGYRPIEINGVGEVEYTKPHEDTLKNYKGEILQDLSGIPYRYITYEKDSDTGENEPVEVFRADKTGEDSKPSFYNRTNYLDITSPMLQEYDEKEYPVFEYLQFGKDIYFNDTFNELGSNNKAELVVNYKYLAECVRVKIVMYRNTINDNGLSPIVNSYAIKTKPFKQFY